MYHVDRLVGFIEQSNAIEGITRPPTEGELEAHAAFVNLTSVTVEALEAFVATIQPGAILRAREGLNVRVGSHFPPPGGPKIREDLEALLTKDCHNAVWYPSEYDVWKTHLQYETLHPFTDGNGRSGRALWLWGMLTGGFRVAPLYFLQSFYYQTLSYSREG